MLESILTDCGVNYPRCQVGTGTLEKSDKNIKEILKIVQSKHGGIVILPHSMSDDGIFDDSSTSEWLQQDQYTNPDLLAIEVPKPVGQMSPEFRKMFRSGDDCHPGWKRIRPIATLMSSDNKKLIEVDQDRKPVSNSIGFRYSWIKMSEPCIESLRQAFLDHESRIILPEDVSNDVHPSERTRQAKIQFLSIKNVAFLDDQEIHFSPNMNCVIGGRGSGKSTVLEYLRIIFGKVKADDLDEGSESRINRVRDTLNKDGAELEVCWQSAGDVQDRLVWKNGQTIVQSRDLPDPDTFFSNLPIRFYSQQQLNRLTESRAEDGNTLQSQRLLTLVDGFAKSELTDLANQERKLNFQIQSAFTSLRKAKLLEKEHKRLQQEHQELDLQWKARSEIQGDASRHQQLKAESRYFADLSDGLCNRFSDVADQADAVAVSHVSFQVEESPHGEWFRQFDSKVKTATDDLAKVIRDAVNRYNDTIDRLKSTDPAWPAIEMDLNQADAKFREACEAKGLGTDDVGHLQEINQAREKKQQEISSTDIIIHDLKHKAGNPEELMQQLHEIWKNQYQTRLQAAQSANDLAVLNEGKQQFIEVSAKYQRDKSNFSQLWQEFGPSDGRTRLGKSWEKCGQSLYDLFVSQPESESPWQAFQNSLSSTERTAGNEFGECAQELYQYVQDNLERWEKLRCTRVQDTVDMKLFRADGSTAGSIAQGSLSDGQRNTAALALLLAQEGGPLVIDQPEDELDSNFVFRELIPMLRKVKSKRQLIMATHNANLPVNGDSEMVYAFEALDGRGKMLAHGGLDQKAVTEAVLNIMEGTEEAFRRRREKYNF